MVRNDLRPNHDDHPSYDVVAAAVIQWLQGGTVGPLPFLGTKKRAFEILEERFAKREIDKKEFEKKKRLLSD